MRVEVSGPWVRTANHNRMQVAEHYPAEWTDVTWQRGEDITQGASQFVAQGVVSAAQLTALLADSRYVVLWNGADDTEPPTLTAPQVDALKTKLEAAWSPDVGKLVTLNTTAAAAISAALKEAANRPPWGIGATYATGAVVQYEGNLFECVQGHTVTDAGWTPDIARSLWKRFYEPTDDPWPWVQPLGAHDAYPVGARVTFGGHTWRNTIPSNVWQPGVTGWVDETPAPITSAWAVGVAYKVGDRVTYGGLTYECQQAHTSQVGWQPPNVLALWLPV